MMNLRKSWQRLPYPVGPPVSDVLSCSLAIQRFIDDSLEEVLGRNMAVAARACVETTLAIEDPEAYVSSLEGLLGARAGDVVQRAQSKFQGIGDLRYAGITGFGDSIAYLTGVVIPAQRQRERKP